MTTPHDRRDNETWLIDAAHAVLAKRVVQGDGALTLREQLIHRFWVADLSMRRTGDLASARDLAPRFLEDGRAAARAMELPQATAFFALSQGELERNFFDLFDSVVDGLRTARVANSVA